MERFYRLTLGIAHLQRTIQRIKHLHMDSMGLKGSHVLCISGLVYHPEGMTASQLCSFTGLDKAAVSRILKELENYGYIAYDEADSRQKRYRTVVSLTESGRAIADNVSRRIQTAVTAGRSQINDEELEEFYRILGKLTDNLDTLCDQLENTYENK